MFKTLLIAAALFTLTLDTVSISYLLNRTYPSDPWESGMTLDALRVSQGIPLYEDFVTQRASHMYGWGHSYLLGGLFRVLPVSNQTGRWLTLVCALLVIGFLTRWVSRGQPWYFKLFAFASFLSIHHLADNYTAANRPDWACWLFSLCFLVLFRTRKIPALILLVVACSIKQTAAMWSVVPLCAVVWESGFRPNPRWAVAALPVACVAAYLLVLKTFFPLAFFYGYTTFRHYPVPPKLVVVTAWTTLASLPLFWVLGYLRLAKGKPTSDEKFVGAAWAVTLVACSFAVAKPGGTANSLIPFFLATTTAYLLWLKEFGPKGHGAKASAMGIVLVFLWGLQIFPKGPTLNHYFFQTDARNQEYPRVVEAVSKLQGGVICPEDPTIEWFGRHQLGRNFYLERDVRGPWTAVPAEIEAYFLAADYIVDITDWWWDGHVSPKILTEKGYEPYEAFGAYQIWKKVVRR